MEEIRWPCLRKFKVKKDKESDQTGLSDVQLWKHTSHRICSFINLSHGPWPTNPGGGWHSRARGVKNTSSGSRARARVWGRGLRWWHGWRRLCVCACVSECVRAVCVQTPAASWQRSAIPRAAVSSSQLSCQLTAILRLLQTAPLSPWERWGLQKSLQFSGRGGGEGASGDTWHASSQCVWLVSEDLTATWHKQKPARKTCFRFF